MSEVKPTLVFHNAVKETVPLNSWLSSFPSGKWNDAQNRSWFWVMTNVVGIPSVYEYVVEFDIPVKNTTLVFPFVVKTLNNGVKRVFISGIEYQARSGVNYGDRFVVSGREFRFKIATEYKLSKQIFPLLIFKCTHTVFESVKSLFNDFFVLRQIFSNFKTLNTIETNHNAIRSINPTYITSASTACDYIATRITSSTFNNINSFSIPVIANCRNTSWTRFGGIWQSCETWIPLT